MIAAILIAAWVLGALLTLDAWFTEVEVDENEQPL